MGGVAEEWEGVMITYRFSCDLCGTAVESKDGHAPGDWSVVEVRPIDAERAKVKARFLDLRHACPSCADRLVAAAMHTRLVAKETA